jgi:hypothetical protein
MLDQMNGHDFIGVIIWKFQLPNIGNYIGRRPANFRINIDISRQLFMPASKV